MENTTTKPVVTVYTKQVCPYCMRAKELLKAKGIAYETKDMTNDMEGLMALKERTHHMTVPQIFVGERFVGGFSELVELDQKGELDTWVAEAVAASAAA